MSTLRGPKDYSAALGRSSLLSLQHRRGHSLPGVLRDSAGDNFDLLSRNRSGASVAPSDESELSSRLGRISVGSGPKVAVRSSGLDDLLASTDGGKHDYDWLLTPPETPLPSSEKGHEFRSSSAAVPRSSPNIVVRSTSAVKPSRQPSDITSSYRPARSSSVTRTSLSYTQNNGYSSSARSSSLLNTSLASVSSYMRPSSPVTRSPSTPSGRTVTSRSSTPSKSRSVPTLSSGDKPRPSQSSRPSTPSSRTLLPNSTSSHTGLYASRPSTPTRRAASPGASTTTSNILVSAARVLSKVRNQNSSPRVRSPQRPVIPPDFPLETPPNLRTTLPPDRPVSAGRSRPGASAARTNTDNSSSTTLPRRSSSPITMRARNSEPNERVRSNANNGHSVDISEPRKVVNAAPESLARKTVKEASTGSENGGFGRSISKKSLDMAIRHMDIRKGPGSTRPIPGTILYPQSIRSASVTTPKSQPVYASSPNAASQDTNGNPSACSNGYMPENGKYSSDDSFEIGKQDQEKAYAFRRITRADIFESSRYDTMLMKEDVKNTSWLHSLDDKFDHGPIFENGFEYLPEPFGLS